MLSMTSPSTATDSRIAAEPFSGSNPEKRLTLLDHFSEAQKKRYGRRLSCTEIPPQAYEAQKTSAGAPSSSIELSTENGASLPYRRLSGEENVSPQKEGIEAESDKKDPSIGKRVEDVGNKPKGLKTVASYQCISDALDPEDDIIKVKPSYGRVASISPAKSPEKNARASTSLSFDQFKAPLKDCRDQEETRAIEAIRQQFFREKEEVEEGAFVLASLNSPEKSKDQLDDSSSSDEDSSDEETVVQKGFESSNWAKYLSEEEDLKGVFLIGTKREEQEDQIADTHKILNAGLFGSIAFSKDLSIYDRKVLQENIEKDPRIRANEASRAQYLYQLAILARLQNLSIEQIRTVIRMNPEKARRFLRNDYDKEMYREKIILFERDPKRAHQLFPRFAEERATMYAKARAAKPTELENKVTKKRAIEPSTKLLRFGTVEGPGIAALVEQVLNRAIQQVELRGSI